ncbi:glycoside hydrolase family protein [Salix suchowensis]|nr:glycoside hydrolase family protein [Salix suchowensis]
MSSRRSSTSQSVRSTKSLPPAAWRSLSSRTKQSTPPALALVFAQPEQGAPLASAASKLPDLSQTSTPPLTPSPSIRSMNQDSSSSSAGGNEWSSDTDVRSSEAATSESTASTPSRRRPPRPTWFGSLSRAKGRATAPKLERMEVRTATVPDDVTPTLTGTVDITEQGRQPADMSPPSQSDIRSRSEPSPTASTMPSILEPAPVQSSVPFPIPASGKPNKSSSSTRASISSSSPLISSPLRSTHGSSVTSVDDEVPVNGAQTPPPPSPPSVVPSPPNVLDDGTIRPRTLSSLGPASSRFTLSIPLFGRKAPASNEVKTTEVSEGIERSASGSSTSSETPTIRGDPRPAEPQKPIAESTTSMGEANAAEPSASSEDPVIETTTTATTTITTTTSTSTTWWDYLTWKASQPDDTPTNPSTSAANTSDLQHVTPDETDFASSSASAPANPTANVHTDSVPPRISVTDPDNPNANTTPISCSPATATSLPSDIAPRPEVEPAAPDNQVEQAEDVMSVRSTESQGTLAWFSPWACRGSSSDKGGRKWWEREDRIGDSERRGSDRFRRAGGGEKLEGKSDSSPDPDPSAVGPEVSANPIEDTITSNRVGWASFFAARGLLTKRIEMKEEGEMEVMNIDEEEAEVGQIGDATKKDEVEKPSRQTRGVANNTTSSSSTTANKALRRKSASPAPSIASTSSKAKPTKQKSGTSTPASRTPNLVLPTWEDTFHAQPRNHVPPPPPSTLARTMKFVSGVLFAKETSEGESSGVGREASGVSATKGSSLKWKGKSKEIEKEMVHFGKSLPRAWDVMKKHSSTGSGSGSGLAPEDVLRGCRKVVVIGIHGWFPGQCLSAPLIDSLRPSEMATVLFHGADGSMISSFFRVFVVYPKRVAYSHRCGHANNVGRGLYWRLRSLPF